MYQVIARKYRPAQFSELISQEHVRTTLENAINQNRIAHGYILSGQRGTGKTTVARIIARCLNCVNGPTSHPCGECASCREIAAGSSVDVIEIDAASNRGINEMRELRENVRYRPARDRFKVFIVDEAHQITTEAFNALLKTLEEPPEWVVFILCTTESHKIPVTITSRCQQFSFRSVDFESLVDRMRWICSEEGVTADDEVLGIIAQAGEGSVRDSLSALDQAIACCGTTLAAPEVRQLMGLFSLESLREVAEALQSSDPKKMLEVVAELERNGRSLHHFCRELARYFRNLLVARISGAETRLIGASGPEQARMLETARQFSEEDLTRYLQLTLDLYKDLQVSLQPRLHLEIGLLRLVHAGRLASIEKLLSSGGGSARSAASAPAASVQATSGPASTAPPAARPSAAPSSPAGPATGSSGGWGSGPATPPAARPASAPPADSGWGAAPASRPPAAPPKPASTGGGDTGWGAPTPPRTPSGRPEPTSSVSSAPSATGESGWGAPSAPRPAAAPTAAPSSMATAVAVAPEPEPAPAAPAAPPKAEAATDSELRSRLVDALHEMNRPFLVDNVEQSTVEEGNGEYVITAPPTSVMALQFAEADLRAAAQKIAGRAVRVRIVQGAAAAAPPAGSRGGGPRRSNEEEEALQRALADPAIQSFQAAFPGAEIRQVRNLKE